VGSKERGGVKEQQGEDSRRNPKLFYQTRQGSRTGISRPFLKKKIKEGTHRRDKEKARSRVEGFQQNGDTNN